MIGVVISAAEDVAGGEYVCLVDADAAERERIAVIASQIEAAALAAIARDAASRFFWPASDAPLSIATFLTGRPLQLASTYG